MFEDIINFFKGKKSERSNGRKPSPIIITACCLAIVLPLLFAIFYAYFYDDKEELNSNTIEIQLYDADGILLSSESSVLTDISSSPFSGTLYSLMINRNEAKDAKKPFDEPNFKIVLKTKSSAERYLCYITEAYSTSYIQSPTGGLFTVDEQTHTSFMNLDFAETVYSTACPPKLLTGDMETVLPSSVEWSYKKFNNSFAKASKCKTTSDILTYRIGGAVNVSFDTPPDECTTKLYNTDGSLLFEGRLEELPFVTVETGEEIKTEIYARWLEGTNNSFYGEATYSFNIVLVNKAEFSISSNKTEAGGFIVLSVKNADNLSKIIYSSNSTSTENDLTLVSTESEDTKSAVDFIYKYKPSFVSDGNYARALIPFPSQLPSGDFGFSLSYGASKQDFTVSVSAPSRVTEHPYEKTSVDLAAALSSAGIDSLSKSLSSVAPYAQEAIFWRGAFGALSDKGYTVGYEFGNKVISSDELAEFNAIGIEYIAQAKGGIPVGALNIGVVLAVGDCPYLGKYVVVEHGMGLRTWYCGLDSIDVSVGNILRSGESVGKSGCTSLTSGEGVLLLCTVYETPINPYAIIGKTIDY